MDKRRIPMGKEVKQARNRLLRQGNPPSKAAGEFTRTLVAGLAQRAWEKGRKQREARKCRRDQARAAYLREHGA